MADSEAKRARTDAAGAAVPVLYYDPFSVHARLVHVVVLAAGIDVEVKLTDLGKRENHAPAYLALNPTGQVPTLVDGDVVVYESSAIIRYLMNKHSSPLYPRDDLAALGAIETAYEHLRQKPWDAANTVAYEILIKTHFGPHLGQTNATLVAESLAKLDKRFHFLEANFFKTDPLHIASDRLNIADIALGCVLAQVSAAKEFHLDAYPKLKAFYDHLKANEHFHAVHAISQDATRKLHATQ